MDTSCDTISEARLGNGKRVGGGTQEVEEIKRVRERRGYCTREVGIKGKERQKEGIRGEKKERVDRE